MPCPTLLRRARTFLRHTWTALADLWKPARASYRPIEPTRLSLEAMEAREVPLDLMGILRTNLVFGGLPLLTGSLPTPLQVLLEDWNGTVSGAPGTHETQLVGSHAVPEQTRHSAVAGLFLEPARAGHGASATQEPRREIGQPEKQTSKPGLGDSWLDAVGAFLDEGKPGKQRGASLPAGEDGSRNGGGGGTSSAGDSLQRGGAEFTPSYVAGTKAGSNLLPYAGTAVPTTGSNQVVPSSGQGSKPAGIGGSTTGGQGGTGDDPGSNPRSPVEIAPTLKQNFGRTQLAFEINQGQYDSQVRFASRGAGLGFWLTDDAMVFSVARPGVQTAGRNQGDSGNTASKGRDVFRLKLVDANPQAELVGRDEMHARANYFVGNDPEQWRDNVPQYGKVEYRNVFQGVDLVLHSQGDNSRLFEYDFVVQPGQRPDAIRLNWQGLEGLRMDEQGRMLLRTGGGEIVQDAPVAYQMVRGQRVEVAARHVVRENGEVGFELIGQYDASLPVVIDPVIGFGTYLGGSGSDEATSVAVDLAGNTYVMGKTDSSDFPVADGYDLSGGSGDLFLTKLNSTGDEIVYSTYLGGSGPDYTGALAVDLAGSVYATGYTYSSDFPLTAGAYQTTTSAPVTAFVTKLSAAGDALQFSTYLGGNFSQATSAIAVDAQGQAYVTGWTASQDFPTTVGAHSTTKSGFFTNEAFVTKFNAAGSALVYSTFLGGAGGFFQTGDSQAYGLAIDAQGRAWVTGMTSVSSFVTTGGAYQTTLSGTSDAFVLRLNAAGSSLDYSTLLGGSGTETAYGIAVDRDGIAYVTGTTTSSNYPTISGAVQTSLSGSSDAFVTSINVTGTALGMSTYLGGSSAETGYGIAVDSQGRPVVAGATTSSNLPTYDAYQSIAGGMGDGFLTRLTTTGTLSYSSYHGGSALDELRALALDPRGAVYLAGKTSSTDLPGTSGGYQPSNAGSSDAFVAKILSRPDAPTFTTISNDSGDSSTDRITTDQTLSITGTAGANLTVTLERAGVGVIGSVQANSYGTWTYDYTGTTLAEGSYAFTARVEDSGLWSDYSAPEFLVHVDRTAPTVLVYAPTSTPSRGPEARIVARDRYGLPATATVTLDVDLNNDGDYLDASEAGYATGNLFDGQVTIKLPDLGGTGTYNLQARVSDLAGNQGTSATHTFAVTSNTSWTGSAQTLNADPLTGDWQTQLGDVSLMHPLDLDKSPGTAQAGNPGLVYHSSSVNQKPIVQVTLPSANNASLPASVVARLTFDGTAAATVTYSTTGFAPGDVFTLALQSSQTITTTGRYGYSVLVQVTGQADQTLTGSVFVVAQDSSPFGAGWSFAGVDRLVSIAADANGPAGMLRLYGTGGYRFYTGTSTFTSPTGDNGTLSLSGGTYTYSTPDGQDWVFNSSGYLARWESADNKELISYTYDGSNRLSGITAIDGGVSTLTYTGTTSVGIQTVNSRRTTLTLSSGDLTKVTNADGGVHTFTYSSHRLTQEQNGPSLENNWAYTGAGTVGTFTWGATTVNSVTNLSRTTYQPALTRGLSTLVSGTVWASATDPLGHVTRTEMDGQGRTLQSLAANGGLVQMAYTSGYVTRVTEQRGYVTSYTRDAEGYVTKQENPDGGVITYQYQSAFHALTTMVNERGYTSTYAYDGSGHLVRSTDALGQHTTYNYESTTGLLESMIDPRGSQTTMLYDGSRRVSSTIDALGNRSTVTYDSNGNVQTAVNALNRTTTLVNDVMGRQTGTVDALGNRATTTYDSAGLSLASEDALNKQTSSVTDTFKRGLEEKSKDGVGSGVQVSTLASYDDAGQLVAQRDADGWWMDTRLDPVGNVVGTTDELGNTTINTYGLCCQQMGAMDALGRWTFASYDPMNRQTSTTDNLGNITLRTYDLAGNVVSVTDPLNRTTTYTSDAMDRRTGTLDSLGRRTTTVFDAAGNVSAYSDPLGRTTTYAYDLRNRPTSTTQASGTGVAVTSGRVYDEVGNVKQTSDGLGKVVTYSYDAVNRQTETRDQLNQRTTTTYDAVGSVTSVKDALSKIATYSYDALHRQVAVQDPSGQRTTSVLDASGRQAASIDPLLQVKASAVDAVGSPVGELDSEGGFYFTASDGAGGTRLIVDPVGNEWHYSYDGLGREILRTDPNGEATTTSYDAVGRTTSVVDRNSRSIEYGYDSVDRLTGEVWKSSAGVTLNVVTYGYDANDNRLTAADFAGAVTYTYDELNREKSYTNTFGQVLTYGYDANSRRTLREDSFGGVLTTVYDDAGQMTSRRFGGVAQTQVRFDFGYTSRGEQSTITRYSDVAGSTLLGTTTYARDDEGRLTSIVTKNSSAVTLSYYNYAWDSADRITNHSWSSLVGTVTHTGGRTYTYDRTDQLTNDSTTTYSYDANGNRTMSGYQTGVANRMVNDGVFTLTYDDEGNLSSKSKGSGLETWYYTWSNRNQLLNLRKTSDGSTTTLSVTYTYDVEGHRVQEDRWKTGVGSTVARFAWDGEDLWADMDGSNALLVRYIHNGGIDQLLARIVSSGTYAGRGFYMTDNLGSVRGIMDSSMVMQYNAEYDGFGSVIEINAGWGGRYKFTGREQDPDTGLQYHRSRWYDIHNGRWLSEDPIQFGGRDSNLYRFAANSTVIASDPTGLRLELQTGQDVVRLLEKRKAFYLLMNGDYGLSLGVLMSLEMNRPGSSACIGTTSMTMEALAAANSARLSPRLEQLITLAKTLGLSQSDISGVLNRSRIIPGGTRLEDYLRRDLISLMQERLRLIETIELAKRLGVPDSVIIGAKDLNDLQWRIARVVAVVLPPGETIDTLADKLRTGQIKEKDLRKKLNGNSEEIQDLIDEIKRRAKRTRKGTFDEDKIIDQITKSEDGVKCDLKDLLKDSRLDDSELRDSIRQLDSIDRARRAVGRKNRKLNNEE